MTGAAPKPKIQLDIEGKPIGLELVWDLENNLLLAQGFPCVCLPIETGLAGMMTSLQKMVGGERFELALYDSGQEAAAAEYERLILSAPTIEEGLRTIGVMAAQVGLGKWELVKLDREKKEARFRVRNSWEALYQKSLGVSWGASSIAGRFAGYCARIFGENCWAEQTAFVTRGDPWDEFVIRPSERTAQKGLDALASSDEASRADLNASLDLLKSEVQERKQYEERLKQEVLDRKEAEQALLDKIEIIRRQEDSIRAMSTPILQLWDGILALPVIGLVDSVRANEMMDNLLEEIVKTKARYAILDLTGVEVMDTGAADHLLRLVRATSLLGTRCLVSGISPRMAQTIVGLEIDLDELASFSTLEAALRFALSRK